jgi:hypothetical protein
VFPNPTTGKIQVQFYAERKTTCAMKVTDLLGNILIAEDIVTETGTNTRLLDLSSAARGMYFIRLESEKGDRQVLKIILD